MPPDGAADWAMSYAIAPYFVACVTSVTYSTVNKQRCWEIDVQGAVLHAAVRSWFEGHLDGAATANRRHPRRPVPAASRVGGSPSTRGCPGRNASAY
jgi:hypothetical protein